MLILLTRCQYAFNIDHISPLFIVINGQNYLATFHLMCGRLYISMIYLLIGTSKLLYSPTNRTRQGSRSEIIWTVDPASDQWSQYSHPCYTTTNMHFGISFMDLPHDTFLLVYHVSPHFVAFTCTICQIKFNTCHLLYGPRVTSSVDLLTSV